MKKRNHGVFCVEGDWWGDLTRNNSLEPMLQLLSHSPQRLRYIHRNVATPTELKEYLHIWTESQYKGFPILYLGFHGTAGEFFVGDQRKKGSGITLDQLADLLAGKCKGRIIHFGSCETLDWHGKRLNTFLKKTGACCVTGYSTEIGWVRSAAFELFVFSSLFSNQLSPERAFSE